MCVYKQQQQGHDALFLLFFLLPAHFLTGELCCSKWQSDLSPPLPHMHAHVKCECIFLSFFPSLSLLCC